MALSISEIVRFVYSHLVTNKPELDLAFGEEKARNILAYVNRNSSWVLCESEGGGSNAPVEYPAEAKSYKLFHVLVGREIPSIVTTRPYHIFRVHVWYHKRGVVKVDYEKFLEVWKPDSAA